jgi:hypothetical protein
MKTVLLSFGAALALAGIGAYVGCTSDNLSSDCQALCKAQQAKSCADAPQGDCDSVACVDSEVLALESSGCSDDADQAVACELASADVCTPAPACQTIALAATSCLAAYCMQNPSVSICPTYTTTGSGCSGVGGSGGAGGAGGMGGAGGTGGRCGHGGGGHFGP